MVNILLEGYDIDAPWLRSPQGKAAAAAGREQDEGRFAPAGASSFRYSTKGTKGEPGEPSERFPWTPPPGQGRNLRVPPIGSSFRGRGTKDGGWLNGAGQRNAPWLPLGGSCRRRRLMRVHLRQQMMGRQAHKTGPGGQPPSFVSRLAGDGVCHLSRCGSFRARGPHAGTCALIGQGAALTFPRHVIHSRAPASQPQGKAARAAGTGDM